MNWQIVVYCIHKGERVVLTWEGRFTSFPALKQLAAAIKENLIKDGDTVESINISVFWKE